MKSSRFGRYELLSELGKGGMATLRLARLVGPSDFQKFLVLKLIHEELTRDAVVVNRFLDEARFAALIHHPNVVQIYEFDQVNDTYFIAMEHVHGENVAELLHRTGEGGPGDLQWGHAARIVADAAAGLQAAHEQLGADGHPLNLVHRDVSPQNILISFDGNVKVTDFGIAHAVGRIHETLDDTIIGKVGYMSPEQCRGEVVDRRTDIFALGIVLYELVCGRALFRTEGAVETQQRVLHCEIPLPSTVSPDIPLELEQVLLKTLAPLPEARFATAGELGAALEEVLSSRSQVVTSSHLARLMGTVFRKEMRAKDRELRALYQKTFLDKEQGSAARSHFEGQAAPTPSSAVVPSGKQRLGPEVGFRVGGTPDRPPARSTKVMFPLEPISEPGPPDERSTDEVATKELRSSKRDIPPDAGPKSRDDS